MKGGTKLPKSRRLFLANGQQFKAGTQAPLKAPTSRAWSPETGFANSLQDWARSPRLARP
jgi:hypothetical protein